MRKQLHFNVPQVRSAIIDAPVEICVMGRALGKTTKILARKSAFRYYDTMPRGNHVILGSTFTQVFTRTLRELIRGWQSFGYVYDHHFIVGKRPTEKWKKMWNWKGPYAPPDNYKYFISWWNGAVVQVISQANPGSSNGMNIDSIIGDELKFINKDRFQTELIPANRGFMPEFAGNPYHHGMTFTTDMPVGTSGRWILDMQKEVDHKIISEILKLQGVRFDICEEIKQTSQQSIIDKLKKETKLIDEELNDIRSGVLYYHEASTLANIDALGLGYIKELLRTSTQFQFDTQILNLRPMRLEDGFYPDFDEEVHGYFAENEEYFDNLEYDPFSVTLDCRKDKDLISTAPLHMAIDYNRRIWPISVGQVTKKEIRSIKGMHVLYPLKLKEAVDSLCEYYKPHKKKLIYYWYDHTAVGEMYETRMCDDVIRILRKNGWIVKEMYIGQAPGHEEKYRMWGDLLTNSGKYDKSYRVNRECCSDLILSKSLAQAEQRKGGFGKEKKSEKDPKFPAQESTHYSDAEDTWVFGVLESGLSFGNESKGGGGSVS